MDGLCDGHTSQDGDGLQKCVAEVGPRRVVFQPTEAMRVSTVWVISYEVHVSADDDGAFSFFHHYAVWLTIAESLVLQVGPIIPSLHSFHGYLFVVDLVTLLSVIRFTYSMMPQFESVTYRIWMGMDPIRVWRCASPPIRPSISVAV